MLKVYYQSLLKLEPSNTNLTTIRNSPEAGAHWLFDKALANVAYNEKNFVKASELYKNAYIKEANSSNAISWSKSEALNGNTLESMSILSDHLLVEPESNNTKVMLAGAYLNNKDFDKAKALYLEVISADEKNIITLNNLAFIALENKNYTFQFEEPSLDKIDTKEEEQIDESVFVTPKPIKEIKAKQSIVDGNFFL